MVHAVNDCKHLISKLDLEITPGVTKPAPQAEIQQAPTEVSIQCQDMILRGKDQSSGLGRVVYYSWVFTSSEGVDLYESRNYKAFSQHNDIATIPRTIMRAGTVKVTLTIKNFLGETSTDTATIKVVDEKRIMLFFDKGIGNTVYFSKKANFPVITTIGCS
jgi:FlaG/FlaF family flagellin (archaellin)